jgi:hypothetical protein
MGNKERKEFERRQTIEDAYEHPPADVRATRLRLADAGPTVTRLTRLARMQGFEVELWGYIGTAPPRWRKRDPEDAQLSYWGPWGMTTTYRAYKPDAGQLRLGLQAFIIQWPPSGSPDAWAKFASWPVRRSTVTELSGILTEGYDDAARYYIHRADLRESGVIE